MAKITLRKRWIIADTHWYHVNMKKYCNRPGNFGDKIIKQWKHLVNEKDIVFHLGDVIFGKKQQLTEILQDLPGTKVLIKGNHDRRHSDNWFIDAGFAVVCRSITLRLNGTKVLLTHAPYAIHYKNTINVHGHFHNNPKKKWERGSVKLLTDHHYLFVLEKTNYTPILLENAVIGKGTIKSKDVK
jgi:calcineurin-like phosphoesterase family protein